MDQILFFFRQLHMYILTAKIITLHCLSYVKFILSYNLSYDKFIRFYICIIPPPRFFVRDGGFVM